ncbi:AMP-binding protein [Nibrella saemangeumensis]|uniref:AMP-binding protein n=1 Tax=Nibrella saemangeumensis TaxID=1084526 RepID=A0ABP8MZC9_9BACT
MEAIHSLQTDLATHAHHFYHWERQQPAKIYLRQPVGNHYIDYSWGEVGRQARIMATYLNSLGLPPRSNIGLVSKNCAHWIIADIAILLSGHVSVPFYPTLTADQLRQVMEHSGCPVLFVGKLDNWPAMKPGVPNGVHGISFPPYGPAAPAPDPGLMPWEDVLKNYEPMLDSPLRRPDDIYTIVYTSGTTGSPKGVMLDMKAAATFLKAVAPVARLDVKDARYFSYLPLCHIAERNVVEAGSLTSGGTIYFAESLDTFAKNLVAARPTHFLAVPRIWTKFQLGILAKLPQKKLDRLLRIPLLSDFIKRKIRKGLGLNDAVFILTGAAPMPISLIQWFRRLGITIQEAYGMTENLGAVSMMPVDEIKDGTVGKLYDGMDVKIDPDTGEVLTRADWLMRGYYREPEMTAAVLRDGWLYTGDVGELDENGYLKITSRVKDMYKTPKGEYVVPAQIEFGFADNNFVEQICVAGQNLPQPVALVVLSEMGRHADRMLVAQSLEQTVSALNPRLHTYERIRKVVVVKDTWTVENNMMTPTMKIKRNVVEKQYEPRLEPWYSREETIVWEE